MIPYGRQQITEQDIAAVVEVLRSDFLTQGPQVPAFEAALCGAAGAPHAVAVTSATAALHLACLALDVGPGDLVWTADITFVASANAALYCGADVDFVDIDPVTYNISIAALRDKLVAARGAGGRLPKVVIPVHLCGQSCEMRDIHALSEEFGFRVIEDASHAIGARYRGTPVGSCQYSDIAVFSFHPVKIVTTGEGGAAVTADEQLAQRMRLLRTHGITRETAEMRNDPDGPWYYEQIALGFNFRMTDMQAALGRSQLTNLADWVAARNRLADRYDELLAGLPVQLPQQHPDAYSARHLYVIRVPARQHHAVFAHLRSRGIGVNLHYIPLHRQPYYAENLGIRGDWPEAERYYAEAISIPLFHHMSEAQQDEVVQALREALG
ncbi:MAG: UDP-4-amino-4,6-dideoxy-N-acetyl-beta-L-altrosamine transaminase [Gammaproteobacteria bacterium]|jgi:UDP-4-amino-4,6-dideoxy-N-acetyl-beta-L-altrosamine transaminase|nr:UDP-4-amino-4,6-dideoxy-N-acetyl-beta-L-altrosamine transaminase [Gammaproteobacteria bacterium]